MNLEKLKPWNWFKHEDQTGTQIPVTKNNVRGGAGSQKDNRLLTSQHATSSLLQLHQEVDRLFDDVWRSFGLSSQSNLMRQTPLFSGGLLDKPLLGDYRANLDISGDEKEYQVSIDLPGLSESDIHIEVTGNVLTIRGEKEDTCESKEKQYYRVERSFGSFRRTLSLPDDVDKDDITASMKDGVLTICVPRKAIPETDVKRISISS